MSKQAVSSTASSPAIRVAVEKLAGEPGEILDLDRVLLVAGNGETKPRVGSPGVAGAVVRAEVVAHFRGEKIIIFRYKSKVRYRRKTGHRQSLTRLRITDILLDGASSVAADERRAPVAVAEPTSAPSQQSNRRSSIAESAPTLSASAAEAPPTPVEADVRRSDRDNRSLIRRHFTYGT